MISENKCSLSINTQSKIATVLHTKIARSFSPSQHFAIGNLNLYQHQLPVTIAPGWWTGNAVNILTVPKHKKKKAAQQLEVEEVTGWRKHTPEFTDATGKWQKNKIQAAQNEVNTTDSARQEIANHPQVDQWL